MTFELSAEQQALRDRARVFSSEQVEPRSAEIDRRSLIPDDLVRAAATLLQAEADAVSVVIVVEAVAKASGAVALAGAVPGDGVPLGLSGLRGARAITRSTARLQLALAATALGLGAAALDSALSDLRTAAAHPAQETEKPHWVVADAATELEAARLMTLYAAQFTRTADAERQIALARVMASAAAERTIGAALRVAGPVGLEEGALLERLSRDIRAVGLVMGTEEQQRTVAAEGLFPA